MESRGNVELMLGLTGEESNQKIWGEAWHETALKLPARLHQSPEARALYFLNYHKF